MTKTIPLLGNITSVFGLSALQPVSPNGTAKLLFALNNSGNNGSTQNVGYCNNGYWGLQGSYLDYSPWGTIDKTAGGGIARPVQNAIITVNSFGVRTYNNLMTNPTKYRAIDTTIWGYGSRQTVIQSKNSLWFCGNGASSQSLPLNLWKVYTPSALFGSGVAEPIKIMKNVTYPFVSNISFGSPFFGAMYSIFDSNLLDTVPLFCPVVPSPGGGYFANQGKPLVGNAAPQIVTFRGVPSKVWIPDSSINTGNQMSPSTGIAFYKPTGAGANIRYFQATDPNIAAGGTFPNTNDMVFSDSGDNAIFNGGSTANYTPVTVPGGNFLLYAQQRYLLIAGDLSGYYSIRLAPTSANAANAAYGTTGFRTGFGMDLSGNLWAFWSSASNQATQLYTTAGFGGSLVFPHLPFINAMAMGCRRVGGQYQLTYQG